MAGSGSLVAGLADLIWPAHCVNCAAPGPMLCVNCAGSLEPFDVAVAFDSGVDLPVRAAGVFDAGLRAAILAYKERGRRDLRHELAELLALSTAALLDEASDGRRLALVPVPSGRAAARARGGQHVLRLARILARRLGLPVGCALMLGRATLDSTGLGVAERRANLSGAMFAAAPPTTGSSIAAVVLDDVVTTGATLIEAVRALQTAGWPVLGAATIAATPRRLPSVPKSAQTDAVARFSRDP